MRVFNNTSNKSLDAVELAKDVWHLVKCQLKSINDVKKIESLEITDETFTAFGIDCILAENEIRNIEVRGAIQWIDSLSGEGMMRLENGLSHYFFICNVEGANSAYPHLVSNVTLKAGDKITGIVSADAYMFRECGIYGIKKIKEI